MTKDDWAHCNDVLALGCALCRHIHGPHTPEAVELHFLRTDAKGKADVSTALGLCAEHNRGTKSVRTLGTKEFTRYYGVSQHDLLQWVKEQLS